MKKQRVWRRGASSEGSSQTDKSEEESVPLQARRQNGPDEIEGPRSTERAQRSSRLSLFKEVTNVSVMCSPASSELYQHGRRMKM
ncbi:unnamed protein product [Arctogadus glacialis]